MVTANEIQSAILRSIRFPNKVVFNCCPKWWYECDVIELRKSGFWIEYEVKISRADFFADFRKGAKPEEFKQHYGLPKHERFRMGCTECPNEFVYVVPYNLVQPEEVPEYAGLWYYVGEDALPSTRIEVIKSAPKIHSMKDPRILEKVADSMSKQLRDYYKYPRMSAKKARDNESMLKQAINLLKRYRLGPVFGPTNMKADNLLRDAREAGIYLD